MTIHRPPSTLVGVVVRAGSMNKVVKVRGSTQRVDTFLKKQFKVHPSYFVADINSSLRTGDIIRFAPWKNVSPSRRVRHVATEIMSAYGPRLEERPPLPTEEERLKLHEEKEGIRQAKWRAKVVKKFGPRAETAPKAVGKLATAKAGGDGEVAKEGAVVASHEATVGKDTSSDRKAGRGSVRERSKREKVE